MKVKLLSIALVVLLLAACGSKDTPVELGAKLSQQASYCYEFSNLAAGTTYAVGDTLVTPAGTIALKGYSEGGVIHTDGEARIQADNQAGGVANELVPSWINVQVTPDQPLDALRLRIHESYGHNNIEVNGDKREVGHLHHLGGTIIGNALITVTVPPAATHDPFHNYTGELIVTPLTGSIDVFSIGGQELIIDDFCMLY